MKNTAISFRIFLLIPVSLLIIGCSGRQAPEDIPERPVLQPQTASRPLIAQDGYDLVAFFKSSEATKGNPQFELLWKGARYFFSSKENRDAFVSAPDKFTVQVGSYCPVSLATGGEAMGKPTNWSIFEDRLYFFWSKENKEKFEADAENIAAKAKKRFEGMGGRGVEN